MTNEIRSDEVPSFVVDAYKTVEGMLKDAVSGARNSEEFVRNLYYLQTVSSRTLALLIYNASLDHSNQSGQASRTAQLERVIQGIRDELDQVVRASADQANMSVIGVALSDGKQDESNAH